MATKWPPRGHQRSPGGHHVVVKVWIFNSLSIINSKACFGGLRWYWNIPLKTNTTFPQTLLFFREIWLNFWNLEALIWMENGVIKNDWSLKPLSPGTYTEHCTRGPYYRKNSKRPSAPPIVIFWKIILQFFFGKRPKKPFIKVQNLQYKFLDWKWPPPLNGKNTLSSFWQLP